MVIVPIVLLFRSESIPAFGEDPFFMEEGVGMGSQCHVESTARDNHLAKLIVITVFLCGVGSESGNMLLLLVVKTRLGCL
jgi:hypothetical protein